MDAYLRILSNRLLVQFRRARYFRLIRDLWGVTDLVPITRFCEEDIFIVGYPKSGNTWFQNLVSSLNFGIIPELTPDILIQDLVPDVHAKSFYRRYKTPTFFKTHHLPRAEYRRVIYLLRDGRDVMVSYFHHMSALRKEQITFLDFIRNSGNLFPSKWHEHVEQWLSNPYKAEMHIIKYENLKMNPTHEMVRFCEFAHLDRSEDFIKSAIEHSSFDNMRRQELHFGWAFTPGWDFAPWPSDRPFVRRGEIGSFKDEMPPEALYCFLKEASQALRLAGYAL